MCTLMEEDPRYGASLPPLSVHSAPEFLPLSFFNGSVVLDLRTYIKSYFNWEIYFCINGEKASKSDICHTNKKHTYLIL